jgi:uncharacterized protein (UPF0332 family)
MKAAARGYFHKAERALAEARSLLRDNATEGACSRAYYAMFDAAHAALLATGHEMPDAMFKKHSTLIGAFGKLLVQGGLMDAGFGRTLNKVQDIRLLADYSCEPPPLADAQWTVEQAVAFVEAVRAKFMTAGNG